MPKEKFTELAMDKAIQTKNICRICSSRGEYDIFSVIPAYLHSNPNEFLHWKKDISKLLEETTGLSVTRNDGLPQKVCALCISYLKHAATFRQQAIDNIIGLKAAQCVLVKEEEAPISSEIIRSDNKKDICVSADDLIFSETRKTDTNSLVNNILNNHNKSEEYVKKFLQLNNNANDEKNNETSACKDTNNLKTYLNLLFEGDKNKTSLKSGRKKCNRKNSEEMNNGHMNKLGENSDPLGDEFVTASSDENEACELKANFFSYKEKNFEEDDVMESEELKEANIVINIPEHCKERKCRACFRRFMFEDSYKEHMNVCAEYRFLLLIEEVNRLLDIRRSKAISPHEFIRRMIFSLKKTCKWLNTMYGETMSDLLVNGGAKRRLKSEEKSSGAENSSCGKSDDNKMGGLKKIVNEINIEKHCNSVIPLNTKTDETKNSISQNNPLLNLLRSKVEASGIQIINTKPDPLLERLKASIQQEKQKPDNFSSDSSYAHSNVEHSLKLNNDLSRPPINEGGRKSLLESFNKVASPSSPLITNSLAFPVYPSKNLPPAYPKFPFSARCNACNTAFKDIASLEEHNAKYHNNPSKFDEHKKIISMFEGEDSSKNLEGSVDYINIMSSTPTQTKLCEADKKLVKCNTCDRKFATIIHLDQHKIKCHCNNRKVTI